MTDSTLQPPTFEGEEPDGPLNEADMYQDYWGVDEVLRHVLPDGKQYFEFRVMDEGARSRFQKMTNEDLTVLQDRTTKLKMDVVGQRHKLITESVIDWNLMQRDEDGGWSPAPFSKRNLEQWLEKAPPKIVDDLEFAIRKANPWMQADMSVEEIDKEIERLYDLRKQVEEREAGEGTSGAR